jgi:threonine aldolase
MFMRTVDLRSDTITRPTESMKRAMAEAEVGDDVFGEDPTVRKLEEMAAERTGKEAALYVASGTMANLVSQLTHCGRGNEMILGDQCHVFYYEQGGSAAMGGIHPRTVQNQPDGTIDLADIEAAIRPEDVHFPRTRLIVLENTHNRCYGTPISPEYMAKVGQLAHDRGIRLHVDGARIFNAAVALGVDASELAGPADSISFCLSKGLAAPVGSLVCGDQAFIEDARRARKVLGGGMRQAGVLAAAGIVALTEMVDRLAEDHANAKRLGSELAGIPGLSVDVDKVRTNIVYVDIQEPGPAAPELVERLRLEGVRVLPVGPGRFRAVTHYHIESEDIAYALGVFRRVMRK